MDLITSNYSIVFRKLINFQWRRNQKGCAVRKNQGWAVRQPGGWVVVHPYPPPPSQTTPLHISLKNISGDDRDSTVSFQNHTNVSIQRSESFSDDCEGKACYSTVKKITVHLTSTYPQDPPQNVMISFTKSLQRVRCTIVALRIIVLSCRRVTYRTYLLSKLDIQFSRLKFRGIIT